MEDTHVRDLISSPDHPLVRSYRRLDGRAARDRSRLAAIEGVRHVLLAEQGPNRIETLIVSPRLLRSREGRGAVARCEARGVTVARVTPEVFRQLSRAPRASGVAAIVRQAWTPLEQLGARGTGLWLAVRRLDSPGNLGTTLRSAWALGAEGLICLGRDTDPYDPAVLRASMGAALQLQMTRTSLDRLARFATRRDDWAVLGTSARASVSIDGAPRTRSLVVIVGNERKGLSPAERAICDAVVALPLARPGSLNAGVAASVLLYALAQPPSPANEVE